MKKQLIKNLCFSILIALLISMAYFFYNIQVQTVRNGEEYCDLMIDGDVFEQQIMLNNTPNLFVSILPIYTTPEDSVGIQYSLYVDNEEYSGFVPLNSCLNNAWTTIKIPSCLWYSGAATLRLEGVGLTSEDSLQFLITTNTIQEHPELTLSKNGQLIEHGRLSMIYKECKIDSSVCLFVCLFVALFIISIFVRKILNHAKQYAVAYIGLGFVLLTTFYYYPTLYTINTHVSAQYFFSWLDLGFVRRSFVGTVIDLLGVNFDVYAYVMYGIACIVLLALLEICLIYDRRFAADRSRIFKYYIFVLCTPFGLLSFYQFHFFARLDEVLIISFLISCIMIIKQKGMIILPVISLVAIMCHEMYLSMFIPFIFCLLLYQWYVFRQKKFLICLAVTGVTSVGMGAYLGFVAKTDAVFVDVWDKIQATGDPNLIWSYPLQVNFFTDKKAVLTDSFAVLYAANTIPSAILSILLLSPVIVAALIWLYRYWILHTDRLGKWIVSFFPLTAIGLVVSMYSMCDWGRLFVMYGIGVFFSFLTLWSMDAERMRISTAYITTKIGGKSPCIAFAVYCALYLVLMAWGPPSSTTLFEGVRTRLL